MELHFFTLCATAALTAGIACGASEDETMELKLKTMHKAAACAVNQPQDPARPAVAGASSNCDLAIAPLASFSEISRTRRWTALTATARKKVQDSFRLALQGREKDPHVVLKQAERLLAGTDYRLRTATCRGAVVAVWEQAEPGAGGGIFALRFGSLSQELILQTPHVFFDVYTGEIGAALFSDHPIRAFFANTWHRNGAHSKGRPNPDSQFDLTHAKESLFLDLTDTAAEGLAQARIVQLHGFDRIASLPDLRAVVSNGAPQGDPQVIALTAALRKLWGDSAAALFRRDIAVLGGTTNVQGKAVRSRNASFIHIEIAPDERQLLSVDADERLRLLQAIEGLESK